MIQQRMRRRSKYPRDHDLERLDLVLAWKQSRRRGGWMPAPMWWGFRLHGVPLYYWDSSWNVQDSLSFGNFFPLSTWTVQIFRVMSLLTGLTLYGTHTRLRQQREHDFFIVIRNLLPSSLWFFCFLLLAFHFSFAISFSYFRWLSISWKLLP